MELANKLKKGRTIPYKICDFCAFTASCLSLQVDVVVPPLLHRELRLVDIACVV